MVSTQNSSQSSAKKQQSISSFFTKPTAAKTPPALTPKTSNASTRSLAGDNDESLFVASDEEDDVRPPTKRNSNTPKHGREDEPNAPACKRARRSDAQEDDSTTTSLSPAVNENGITPDKQLSSVTANEIKTPKASKHTSKYIFSSSPVRDEEDEKDDEETKRRKARLHEKFVKKLGRPDSIAEIKDATGSSMRRPQRVKQGERIPKDLMMSLHPNLPQRERRELLRRRVLTS